VAHVVPDKRHLLPKQRQERGTSHVRCKRPTSQSAVHRPEKQAGQPGVVLHVVQGGRFKQAFRQQLLPQRPVALCVRVRGQKWRRKTDETSG